MSRGLYGLSLAGHIRALVGKECSLKVLNCCTSCGLTSVLAHKAFLTLLLGTNVSGRLLPNLDYSSFLGANEGIGEVITLSRLRLGGLSMGRHIQSGFLLADHDYGFELSLDLHLATQVVPTLEGVEDVAS